MERGKVIGEPMTETARGMRFKVASEPDEFAQVYDLNHRTFVEEIPQHSPNAQRKLVDPRLDRSTLYVCLNGNQLVGMAAIGGTRPFSLDEKLLDLESYLPAGDWDLCEVRLLAIEKSYRRRMSVLSGLFHMLFRHACDEGHDLAVISAATSQLSLYRRIGFRPFGPPLGTPGAPYQGMYVAAEDARQLVNRLPLGGLDGSER